MKAIKPRLNLWRKEESLSITPRPLFLSRVFRPNELLSDWLAPAAYLAEPIWLPLLEKEQMDEIGMSHVSFGSSRCNRTREASFVTLGARQALLVAHRKLRSSYES